MSAPDPAGFPEVDGYRLLQVIGAGGMSTVYLAEQLALGRKVALKVMLPEVLADEVSRARFEHEARTIARLQHPHIVGIFEVGRTADGLPFYAMPYLPRGHLGQRDLRGDQPKVAAILRALLDALDHAHVHNVVHRDVKAENVLFDESDRPLLADFGIALRRGTNPRLTTAGLAVGSTAYMPPEQARGQPVDRRADLYSLGVLAWEMLTGRLPYQAGDALAMALKHVQEPVPRLPAPLRHWQDFFDRALAKQPQDRPPSARAMREQLDALEQRAGPRFAPVPLPPPAAESSEPAPRWRRRAPWLALAALAVLALGYAGWRIGAGRTPAATAAAPAATPPTTAQAPALPTPTAAPGGAVLGLADPPPLGEGAAFVANAEQQIAQGRLLAPPNGNAWDSWDAAWRVAATHPQVQLLTARLFDALASAATAALREGDAAQARPLYERARQLDARRGGDGSALALLRQRLRAAFDQRWQATAARDPAAAARLLADSAWLVDDPAQRRALQATLAALPATAAPAPAAGAAAAPTPRPVDLVTVTRADYARFAEQTGRAPADCGRAGLFGGRRTWQNAAGRRARDDAPVTCVSAADALAYLEWRNAQGSGRFRVPSMGELRSQPDAQAWSTLCGDAACSTRMASGRAQPLDASRGQPEVGIRLVRVR